MQVINRSTTCLRTICRSIPCLNATNWPNNRTNDNDNRNIVLETLEERDVLSVRGEEAHMFLQGLTTNDMSHLKGRSEFTSMYTMFLNRNGRVLYDTIIYRAPKTDTYLIECDRAISVELRRYLRQFCVRRKIDIENANSDFNLWVAYNPQNVLNISANFDPDLQITPDPRLNSLGLRIISKPDETLKSLMQRFMRRGQGSITRATPDCNYRLHRYQLGVGEGVNELPPGKCFPLEANADFLHGVSFQKGCYIGQELTARTFHTGVIRKRLMPLQFSNDPLAGASEIQNEAGNKVGTLRGQYGKHGLALLHIGRALNAPVLFLDGEPCYAHKPEWWPAELSAISENRVSG